MLKASKFSRSRHSYSLLPWKHLFLAVVLTSLRSWPVGDPRAAGLCCFRGETPDGNVRSQAVSLALSRERRVWTRRFSSKSGPLLSWPAAPPTDGSFFPSVQAGGGLADGGLLGRDIPSLWASPCLCFSLLLPLYRRFCLILSISPQFAF